MPAIRHPSLSLSPPRRQPMHYKTIVLAMLQDRPALHEELRRSRTLLSTMERYALELKESHAAWQKRLASVRPGSDPSQLSSEALELALEELQARIPSDSAPSGEASPFSPGETPNPTPPA
jgi:hypothetical protein